MIALRTRFIGDSAHIEGRLRNFFSLFFQLCDLRIVSFFALVPIFKLDFVVIIFELFFKLGLSVLKKLYTRKRFLGYPSAHCATAKRCFNKSYRNI